MTQYYFQVYFIFILHIIIRLKYGISQENGTTEIVDASSILPEAARENVVKEVADATNVLRGISQESGTREEEKTSDILLGISLQSNATEIVAESNILPTQICEPSTNSCYVLQKYGHAICYKWNETQSKDVVYEVHRFLKYGVNAKYLPARAFFGFCIRQLDLDAPDLTLDENVFDGMVYGFLNEFNVQQSNIKVILHFILYLGIYLLYIRLCNAYYY